MLRIAVIYILLTACVLARDEFPSRKDSREVMTEAGLVRGYETEHYVRFLGVPYAAPPIGPLRFKAPERPIPWKGTYDAGRIVKCPQRGEGEEDCLILNIFTPKTINAALPVLVYIHGGSFLIGTGQVRGVETLTKQDIIVVTINYRLGALGFLCLGIEEAPGNAGLKDQVAALEWIKRNIGNFGGDPNQVTIYGMSAGGVSVEYLVLSKRAEGLFKKAIVESGSTMSVWAADANPILTAYKVAKKLNFPVKNFNPAELHNVYQQVPAKELTNVNYAYYNNLTDGTFGFVPCVEKKGDDSAFITKSPHAILADGNYTRVPTMVFFATVEGLYLRSSEYYEERYAERMSANFHDFVPADLVSDAPEMQAALAETIKTFYFNNSTIGEDRMKYLNYFGDYLIVHGLLNSAEIHSRNDNPVYLLEFAYKGSMGSYDIFFENIKLAGHGDVVKHVILNIQPQSNADKLAVARVSTIVGNFVKHGNPIPDRSPILPILWPAVRPGNVIALYLDEQFRVIDEPHWESMKFWDDLYKKFRRPITPVGGN